MEREGAGLAAYERVTHAIKSDILSGVLQPDQKLPGNRALAERYGVALGTAQKALKALQDDGWLVSQPAVGVFVSHELPADDRLSLSQQVAQLQSVVADLTMRVADLENQSVEHPKLPRFTQ